MQEKAQLDFIISFPVSIAGGIDIVNYQVYLFKWSVEETLGIDPKK